MAERQIQKNYDEVQPKHPPGMQVEEVTLNKICPLSTIPPRLADAVRRKFQEHGSFRALSDDISL